MTEHVVVTDGDGNVLREFDVPAPKVGALFCWPVEWVDDAPDPGAGMDEHRHVTALYLPNVTEHVDEETGVTFSAVSKDILLDTVRSIMHKIEDARKYRLADVVGIDAFGPNLNVPVLKVAVADFTRTIGDPRLSLEHNEIAKAIRNEGIPFNADYCFSNYVAHSTVPLPTLVNPPKQVLLRPLELWYMEEEPVVV